MIQHKDAPQAIWETISLTLVTRCVNIGMKETGEEITRQTCFKQYENEMVFIWRDVHYFLPVLSWIFGFLTLGNGMEEWKINKLTDHSYNITVLSLAQHNVALAYMCNSTSLSAFISFMHTQTRAHIKPLAFSLVILQRRVLNEHSKTSSIQ